MGKGKIQGFWQRLGIFLLIFWQQKALSISMIVTLAALIILISTYFLQFSLHVRVNSLIVFCIGLVIYLYINFPLVRSSIWLVVTWVVLTVCAAGLIIIIIGITQELNRLGIEKEIIAVLITALASIFSLIVANLFQHDRDLQQKRLEKISPTYEKFIDFLIEYREGVSTKHKESELIDEFNKRIIIDELNKGIRKWGSYKVRRLWNNIVSDLSSKRLEEMSKPSYDELIRFLFALRKQVGLPNESEDEIRKSLKPPSRR